MPIVAHTGREPIVGAYQNQHNPVDHCDWVRAHTPSKGDILVYLRSPGVIVRKLGERVQLQHLGYRIAASSKWVLLDQGRRQQGVGLRADIRRVGWRVDRRGDEAGSVVEVVARDHVHLRSCEPSKRQREQVPNALPVGGRLRTALRLCS